MRGYFHHQDRAKSSQPIHRSRRSKSPKSFRGAQPRFQPADSSASPDNLGRHTEAEERHANNSICPRHTPGTSEIPIRHLWSGPHPVVLRTNPHGRRTPHRHLSHPNQLKPENSRRKPTPGWDETRSGTFCNRWEPWCSLWKTREISTHLIYTGAIRTIQQNCSPGTSELEVAAPQSHLPASSRRTFRKARQRSN